MSASQSILNNLKSIKDNSYGANKALQILREAKQRTHKSEQVLITELVLFAFENNPAYDEIRRMVIDGEAQSADRARSCLKVLSAATGRRQQSLIAEMVIYGGLYKNDLKVDKK